MYHSHFGLKEAPFSIKVNPSFLFMTQQHKDALATLLYGASSEGGFALLTGEVGTGKTTLIRALLQQLPSDVDTALVLNPTLNPAELLATICDELKIEYSRDEQNLKSLTDKLHHYLLDRHSQGRGVVVLIDEAQHLQFEALEQIRLLTNLETDTRKLLQIILVGQPELNTKLNQPELKQLAQRITARFHLGALTVNEAQAYVRHRLQVAGLAPAHTLFPEPLVERIHHETEGVPRLINILCDRVLLGAYARNTSTLDDSLLDAASKEVFGTTSDVAEPKKSNHMLFNLFAVLSLIAVSLFAYFQVHDESELVVAAAIEEQETPVLDTNVEESNSKGDAVSSTRDASEWWTSAYKNEADALNALLTHRGITDFATDNPCSSIKENAIACHQQSAETWPELTAINRILVLQLLTPSKFHRYVAVLAITEESAEVLMLSDEGENQPQQLSLAQLGLLWTGKSTALWAAPKGFEKPVGLGSSGSMVGWVAQRFARLDQQPEPLANRLFNKALSERVKLFQRAQGLEDDGIVGMQTALKLNDALNEHAQLKLGLNLGDGD